jgi:hypothetical protein
MRNNNNDNNNNKFNLYSAVTHAGSGDGGLSFYR